MRKYTNKLYCFSPPVMIATFMIEVGLLTYVVVRHKMTPLTRLVAALLAFLALFQLAEYNVCGGLLGFNAETWSRIGYVSITALPPLAFHLIVLAAKAGRRWQPFVALGYGVALGWAVFFTMAPSAFDGHACAGNYAIFQIGHSAGRYYFGYYYLWLLAGIAACIYFARSDDRTTRNIMLLQLTGYLSFLLPTAIANTVNPSTTRGIPSIMCGFAVIYALILAFYIVPQFKAAKTAPARRRTSPTRNKA